ncbi:Cytochrome P450 CYP4 [Frankliniella occidentalis]|nr:cytochrome P450 4C1 isoform X2 [Frankliniella occidentalis]XP_052123488.1 cytochrome P450 4C1 isoform X2 [Frankliniella occidentalis]XP_052123492.1 cytochrome P450 4C1 isoform X2 [Frankliniella occidentalis]KAE8752498.1 Cytochrome P450 CYP4 [Frankliniella occidentalis]
MDAFMLAVVLVALAIFARYLKRKHLVETLDRIPGPPGYPVIGNTMDLVHFKFNLTNAVASWTAQYGDIFKIWLGNVPFVILTKPEDLEILLSSNKHIEKAELYALLHPWIGEGLLTSTGKKWHTRRKLLTPTFHFRILDQFVEVFNRCGELFVKKLLEQKEAVNVHELITLCTLDIICETAMGTKVEAQNDATSSYVTAVHKALISFHQRTMKPWLHLNAIWNMSSDGKNFNSAVTELHKYTNDVISSRRKERESRRKDSLKTDQDLGLKKREAFLDQLLDASDSGADLTDTDIREEVDTFMFEGHDTTAAALSFIMYNVAAHPEVQQRLREEMFDLFGDSDRQATVQDIQNMKYAERVVKESLRLYPSVPLFARKMREDLPLTDGYVLPAGTNVTVSCLQMGSNPKHWPEPEKFDPDRYLTENSSGRHPYAYVPFSAGPRNCIGQKFAMMEMKSALSKIVRSCDLSLPSPGYKPRIEGQVILRAPEGVFLKVAPYRAKA